VIGLIAPDSADRAELAARLAERGFRVSVADAAGAPVPKLVAAGVDAIVLDLAAPDALKLLRRHPAQWRRLPVICLADRRQPGSASEALRLGAIDIVARPLRISDLLAALGHVAELAAAPADDEPDPQAASIDASEDDGIVFGASAAMRDALGLVRRVAPSHCNVLIVGEHGTGRKMLARAIHARGPRRGGPFVAIACAAAEPSDFAAVFDARDRGLTTLYLDDVGELPQALQPLLEARLRPPGAGADEHEPDRPRVLAAAQPRLFDLVDRRVVSRALVEALAVVRIDLAPLRQRPQDVMLLAIHFLKEACREAKVAPKTFSRAALQLLRALPWRGNAAELKSLCERLALVVPRGIVSLEDVLANVRFDTAEAAGRSEETLRQARERFERDYVAAVVQQNRGRIGAAARQLGIERTNLYRKLKQLNIPGAGRRE
jgi:DNA-binding NtrC family response regulator